MYTACARFGRPLAALVGVVPVSQHSLLALIWLSGMCQCMAQNDSTHKKGFIGETPHWGLMALGGFAVVAGVLASLIFIFR